MANLQAFRGRSALYSFNRASSYFIRNKLSFPPKVLILLKRTCSATAVDCIYTEYRHLHLKKTVLSTLLPLPENIGQATDLNEDQHQKPTDRLEEVVGLVREYEAETQWKSSGNETECV